MLGIADFSYIQLFDYLMEPSVSLVPVIARTIYMSFLYAKIEHHEQLSYFQDCELYKLKELHISGVESLVFVLAYYSYLLNFCFI